MGGLGGKIIGEQDITRIVRVIENRLGLQAKQEGSLVSVQGGQNYASANRFPNSGPGGGSAGALKYIRKNSGGSSYQRTRLNLIEGANITITVADDSTDDEVDVTIAAAAPGIGGSGTDNHDMRWDGTSAAQNTGYITDDSDVKTITKGGNLRLRITPDTGKLLLELFGSSGSNQCFNTSVDGDSNPRLLIRHNGAVESGSGSGATDSVLVRSAAGWWQTQGTGFHIDGPQKIKRISIGDANYTVLAADYLVVMATLTATRTVTLPNATGNSGQVFVIKDSSGSLVGGKKITVATAGGNIDGAATYDLTVPYSSITLFSDGSNYGII